MEWILWAVSVVCYAGGVWVLRGALTTSHAENRRSVATLVEAFGQREHVDVISIESRLMSLEDAVDRLPSKWEDVKRESRNYYQRAGHHVRRARKELEEHGFTDGHLEEFAGELQLIDVEGSREEAVQPVPAPMAPEPGPREEAVVVEPWEIATLRRKYGG